MSATPLDQRRIDLENIIAVLLDADGEARAAMMLISEFARTDPAGDALLRVARCRKHITEARRQVAQFHPDAR